MTASDSTESLPIDLRIIKLSPMSGAKHRLDSDIVLDIVISLPLSQR